MPVCAPLKAQTSVSKCFNTRVLNYIFVPTGVCLHIIICLFFLFDANCSLKVYFFQWFFKYKSEVHSRQFELNAWNILVVFVFF